MRYEQVCSFPSTCPVVLQKRTSRHFYHQGQESALPSILPNSSKLGISICFGFGDDGERKGMKKSNLIGRKEFQCNMEPKDRKQKISLMCPPEEQTQLLNILKPMNLLLRLWLDFSLFVLLTHEYGQSQTFKGSLLQFAFSKWHFLCSS